jgi:molecular chaperone HtpG
MATHHFKTEVSRLLDLIIHSLYSNKEIFLRELVSNSSDAIDKLSYLRVSDEAYKGLAWEPRIDVRLDKEAKTLAIVDNGVGMDEKELEENLGTIARSGTRRFIEAMAPEAKKDSNLIGQFGVGFYSAYMVADHVDVTSRRAGKSAFRWSSDGKGEYTIEPVEKFEPFPAATGDAGASDGTGPATEVLVHLNGEGEDFLSRWKLEDILKRYSNHIAYPIHLVSMEKDYDEKGESQGEKLKDEQVNAATALWRRNKSELKDEDYRAFYKSFAEEAGDRDGEPLLWMHTKAEGTLEYTTLFYIPAKAPFDLYRADYRPGVKLYVKRVFITDDEKELLPVYLRFVRGVIDSEDLPLNVSREILQENRVMAQIRQSSVKKILTELADLSKSDPVKYKTFIDQFNRPLKEGLYSDYANREALLGLVRFKSSSVEGWTSLADYKARAKEGQKSIYYISGDNEERLRKSPLLEMYKKEGVEVLICDDEVDEIVISGLGPFEGLDFKAVNRSGSEEGLGEAKAPEVGEEASKAVERAKKILGAAVKDVRLSKRLEGSPSCVVLDSDEPSIQLREMLKGMGGDNLPETKPILELNGAHALVKRLAEADDGQAEDLAKVLLGQALLVEGTPLEDPADFAARLNRLLG